MASPQREKGFTPVAHEILDEICQYEFNGSQFRIIIKVWRLTYGYNRKDHEFSQSFLQTVTGLSESTIKRESSFLIKKKVLLVTKKETSTDGRKLAFNKNYDEWNIPKSGDSVDQQIDLFSSSEGSDLNPQNNDGRGGEYEPPEGSDLNPLDAVSRGQIRPPYKEIRSLKKSIKEKENMFNEFYSIYPRKISRKKTESSWKTLCKDNSFDADIAIAYTTNFIETCKLLKTEVKFIPYPTTFLNQKRYEDYPVIDPEGISAEKQTKFESNLEFLKGQIGGDYNEPGSSGNIAGKSIGSLPESSSRIIEE
jgi:phage replication O-like protein O